MGREGVWPPGCEGLVVLDRGLCWVFQAVCLLFRSSQSHFAVPILVPIPSIATAITAVTATANAAPTALATATTTCCDC